MFWAFGRFLDLSGIFWWCLCFLILFCGRFSILDRNECMCRRTCCCSAQTEQRSRQKVMWKRVEHQGQRLYNSVWFQELFARGTEHSGVGWECWRQEKDGKGTVREKGKGILQNQKGIRINENESERVKHFQAKYYIYIIYHILSNVFWKTTEEILIRSDKHLRTPRAL